MGKLKYYCNKCKRNHFLDSKIGLKHYHGSRLATEGKATIKLKQRVKNIVNDVKCEMISAVEGHKTDNWKKIDDIYWKKIFEIGNEMEKDPIYASIMDKRKKTDKGMHFDVIHYTEKELNFMKNDPSYLKQRNMIIDMQNVHKNEQNNFLKRMKSGKMTPDKQTIYDNAEFTIWNKASDFFGKDYGQNYPMFTVDADYYDNIKYDWIDKIDDRLKKHDLFVESYDAGTYVIGELL